jgi:hypothetical protein
MTARLSWERLSWWGRLLPLMAGWVLIAVVRASGPWPFGAVIIALLALGWLYWLERTVGHRTQMWAVAWVAIWIAASFVALVAALIGCLVVATIGYELGLWGSPWDGR